MVDNTSFLFFILASLTLLLIPGPAVLYIVTRSIHQGRTAGIVSVFGIGAGGLVHVLAAAFGLSALLVSSALAFMIVKYLGALYLIYLGVITLMRPNKLAQTQAPALQSLPHIFRQGAVVNILNPKTALFFFTFIPQFVDPTGNSIVLQILFLGGIFVTLAIVTDGIYALIAGTLGNWLKNNPTFLNIQKYVSGGIYIFLGVATAVSGSSSQK